MDVPITIGVVLALAMSVAETWNHGRHAYFDGVVMLLFFLLIGRYLYERLDAGAATSPAFSRRSRQRPRRGSMPMATTVTPIAAIAPGDRVLLRPGERVSVDGIVETGRSELDQNFVTGETAPVAIGHGERVHAGTPHPHRRRPCTVEGGRAGHAARRDRPAGRRAAAVGSRSRYVRLSDRAARLYAPVVQNVGWLRTLPPASPGLASP
ncbi:Cu2+-exporting ATPase OS=Bosea thiooxidans OX=53254 GN=ARD30_14665 PE=3 SV=1 [Bosea thiooxidans]